MEQRGLISNLAITIITAFALVSCSDTFMKSDPRKKTSALADLTTNIDSAGNVTASFDPSSGSVQVLRISTGTLAGAGLAMPPGALSIPVSITVGEGETLASSSFGKPENARAT